MSSITLDFATLSTVLPAVAAAKHPILIRGRHGVGKSQTVYQFADSLGLPVIERRASQMTEGDLLGLPDQAGVSVGGRKATAYNPPAWFMEACTKPVVLFIDEIDRATTEVRQGFFELTDSRKLAGFTLHEGTIIIAAVNGGVHAAEYAVADMDPAELDRYTVFDVEPTVEDWVNWAVDNVSDVIVDFIRHNPSHLEHRETFEPSKVYPSRRSWARFSKAATSLLEDCKANRAVLSYLSAGYIGTEASIAFTDFAANYERQVSVEDIVTHGRIDRVADFGVVEHTAMCDKMEQSGIFNRVLTADELQNLGNYFVRLPSEVAMRLIAAIPRGEGEGNPGAINVAAFYGITADNGQQVSEVVMTSI